MLPPEQLDFKIQEDENEITSSCVPVPIRGIIFDVGSTLFLATQKQTRNEMNDAIKRTLSTHFNWTSQDTNLFWSHYTDIQREYDAKKMFIGSGTIYDEGWCDEPSIKSWIIGACTRMNSFNVNPQDTIYDDAIKAFRTPRVRNVALIPNVIETLTELRDTYGIKLAICSNDRCKTRLRAVLQKHGLLNADGASSEYFDIIIISAVLEKRKPDVRTVIPILTKWKTDYNIDREHVVFIGDKLFTDIQVARRLGLRAIQCKLYNRHDAKYKKQKKPQPNAFGMKRGTYLGGHSEDIVNRFNAFQANYNRPDAVLKDYNDFIPILKQFATTQGCIQMSNFNVRTWKPIVIGVLLRPKKIEKFRKMRIFETMEYRKDIVYKAIDVTADIESQGPFDIILHKLNWYHFNATFDDKIALQLEYAMKYMKRIRSNIQFEDNDMKSDITDNGTRTYISDDPQLGIQCQDRWYVYNTINNANIRVDYGGKENVKILCPKTILITHAEVKELRDGADNDVLKEIKSMQFPLYFKPRTSGRTPTNRYDGHCLYIIPSADSMDNDKDLFNKLLLNENGDWIVQEYIDHISGCHKVYNLGYFVFASINGSTPCIKSIMDQSEQFITIHSTGISSKQNEDQSQRDLLGANKSEFYQKISSQLKHAFNVNLFGFDMVFDCNNNGYVVDFNFMPSFKIVQNFHVILTEYLLYEYHHFTETN